MKSRRTLSAETALEMVKLRDASRAYARFHDRCFWSYDARMKIDKHDISWVADQLKKNGGCTTYSQ